MAVKAVEKGQEPQPIETQEDTFAYREDLPLLNYTDEHRVLQGNFGIRMGLRCRNWIEDERSLTVSRTYESDEFKFFGYRVSFTIETNDLAKPHGYETPGIIVNVNVKGGTKTEDRKNLAQIVLKQILPEMDITFYHANFRALSHFART